MKMHDYTPIRPPRWANARSVEAFAACLLHSNHPPMPAHVRVAMAMQHAFADGLVTGQAQIAKKARKRPA